jgi:glycosyltransferase involved in cell wall biosynthesis
MRELQKIVIIALGQVSTNPRTVKEAESLTKSGYEVTVLYSYTIDWAVHEDKKIFEKAGWKHEMKGGSPLRNKHVYSFTRVRFKFARLMNRYLGNKMLFAERAQARAFDELLNAATKIKADWYVGHNLGSLAIAVKAAKFNKAKVGFDFEDYHRGEDDATSLPERPRIIYLENKYVPQLNYISAASPMIAHKVASHFPKQEKSIITLLNCFPLSQQPAFREKEVKDQTLQLFWFSQTIGINRGLEILIEAMIQMNDPNIHLTLVGRCSSDFQQYIDIGASKIKEQIHLAGIVSPDELPAFASKFDVGLALELLLPENRNLCLTNKIFTYLLAGNAIILSETEMQKNFNEQFKVGRIFPINDINALTENLTTYKNHKDLNLQRTHNYEMAKQLFNWDREAKALLKKMQDL